MVLPLPHFSTLYTEVMGNPLIEILRDGKSFWEKFPWAKQDFCFGIKKAKWIIRTMPFIEEFVLSEGCKPCNPDWQETDDSIIVRFSEFESHNREINRPYLEISGTKGHKSLYAIPGSKKKINETDYGNEIDWSRSVLDGPIRFGIEKAKALITLRSEIDVFSKKT